MQSTIDSGVALRLVGFLSILYSAFVIYGSLVPLHYVPIPFSEALTSFQKIPFLTLGVDSRADWVANLLLFIPLSFLYNQLATFRKSGAAKHLMSLATFAVSAGIAIGIEFAQLYFPQRTVSQNDILAESLGSIIGIALQYAWGRKFLLWLQSLWHHESSSSRLKRALHVYLTVLLAFSVLPLDLTISPVELYHKWNEGRVVLTPFGGLKGSFFENLYETLTDLLIWVPAGLLWSLDSKHSVARIAVMGWLAATAIEIAQIFVYSRVTDITDIFLAGIGAAVGAALPRRSRKHASADQPNSVLWFAFWTIWAVAILAIFWFPFDFDASRVTLGSSKEILFRTPLENYYFGSEYHATNEFLRKIGFFLPGGILWGVAAHQRMRSGKAFSGTGGLAIFLLALIVEIGQLYLPQKYADVTDVLIQTAGGFLGLVVAQWVLSGHTDRVWQQHGGSPEPAFPTLISRHTKASTATPIWKPHLATFSGLAIAIGTVTHLPFVPYNVKELIAPGIYGVFSVIGLSLAVQWLVNGHFLFLDRCNRMHGQMLYLPLWLIVHGAVTWILLRLSVPMESIHDVVGAPVLGWIWEWELIGRYLALHGAIALQIIGAMALLTILRGKCQLEIFFTWLIWSILLVWPIYWIVVSRAATDNLTELMLGGGTFASSALLAIGFFFFFFAGAAISNLLATRLHYRQTLVLAGIAVFIVVLCFWFGTEQVIVKYGKVFSAWQFLLSPNREIYVSGARLYLHFALALGTFLCLWSLVQAPVWRTLAAGKNFRFSG